MANEVKIIVRSHNDTARGFQSARTDVTRWADESAKLYTERMTLNMQRFGRNVAPAMTKSGQEMGGTLGDSTSTSFSKRFLDNVTQVMQKSKVIFTRTGEKIGQDIGDGLERSISDSIRRGVGGGSNSTVRVRSDGGNNTSTTVNRSSSGGTTDRDKDRFSLRDWLSEGKDAAASFFSGFSDRLSTFFSGDVISMVVKGLGITALGTLLAVPLSAAITTAIGLALGGGVIALGVAAAFKDARITAAAGELKVKLGRLFEDFGKPFRGPVADFLEKFTRDFLPQLSRAGKRIADAFAPLAGDIGNGLIGMLQNMLPGIEKGLKGIEPIIKVLADRMPEIGQALGDFFAKIGGQGDDAAVFFNDLITAVLWLIDVLGNLVAGFTSMYANIRNFTRKAQIAFLGFMQSVTGYFGQILDAASASLSWIPGIGGKLKAAQAMFSQFRKNVNAELGAIQNRVVSVTIEYSYKTFGKPYSDVDPYAARGYASGGITGAASGKVSGGLSWVGEHGPELVRLPTGGQVFSNGDSMRMAQGGGSSMQGGGGQHLTVSAHPSMEQSLTAAIIKGLRFEIGRMAGGNVQQALGGGPL